MHNTQQEYIDKLRAFHDSFIAHSLAEIRRLESLSPQKIITSIEQILEPLRAIPILGIIPATIISIIQFRRNILEPYDQKTIKRVFNLSDPDIILILSDAIINLMSKFEAAIISQSYPELRALAELTQQQLFKFIKTGSLKAQTKISVAVIIEILSKLDLGLKTSKVQKHQGTYEELNGSDIGSKYFSKRELILFPSIIRDIDIFIGREKELAELDSLIELQQIIFISAPSGTGKSTLAQKYGLIFKKRNKISIWIEEGKVESVFLELAHHLKIETNFNPSGLKRAVYEKIKTIKREILLIFDNVDSEEYRNKLNREYLEELNQYIRIIVTTKNSEYHNSYPNSATINLDAFNAEEARQYLQENGVIGTSEDVTKLISTVSTASTEDPKILYTLPQKLSFVVGAFKAITLTIPKYIKTYQAKKLSRIAYPEFEIVIGELFEKVTDEQKIQLEAWKILQYSILLDPDFIPIEVFEKIGIDEERIDEAIKKLQSLGLVQTLIMYGSIRGIKLHRITQDAVLEYQAIHRELSIEKNILLKQLILRISDIFPKVTEQPGANRKQADILIKSVMNLIKIEALILYQLFENHEISKIVQLLHKVGEYYMLTQMHDNALELHKKAEELLRLNPHSSGLEIATAIAYQGRTYASMRNWDSYKIKNEDALSKAIEKHKAALEIRERLCGDRSEIVAHSLGNIGYNYFFWGKYDEAMEYIDRSVSIYKKLYLLDQSGSFEHFKKLVHMHKIQHADQIEPNEFHAHCAAIINTLGAAYYRLSEKKGNENKAQEYANKSLEYRKLSLAMREVIYSKDHVYTALNLYAVGESYSLLKNYEESIKYMKLSLKMRERLFPDGSETLAGSLHALGREYLKYAPSFDSTKKLELLEEALKYQTEAHDMAMKLLPRGNHPNMLAIYFDIGCIHGQYAQEIRKRILPLLDYSFPSWSNIRNLYDQWQTHIKQRQQFFKDIVEQKLENFRENLESKPKIEQSKEKLRSMDQDAYHLQNTIKEKLILSSADWYTAKEEITSIKFLLNSNINKELPGTNKFAQANYFTIDNKLLLASFAMKETIEAAPILIYFSEKILHLPLPKLPDFLNNNIAFITMHYLACNLGMLSIGKLSILTPLALTATYASKIITYSYLAELKQDNFKNSDNKLINNPIDFINKCGFDIAAQTVLGVVGSVIAGTPFIYDVAISATISGMQCYDLHNQEKKNTTSSTAITIADLIPYIVDGAVLYASTRSMHFDLTIPIGKMAAIKQVYTVMSFVVIADYTTKLIMPNFQDTHLDYVTKAVGHIYEYFIGGVEAPEF